MTWHADSALLAQYHSEQLSDARMASVEMHLTSCPACRALVSEQAAAATVAAR